VMFRMARILGGPARERKARARKRERERERKEGRQKKRENVADREG